MSPFAPKGTQIRPEMGYPNTLLRNVRVPVLVRGNFNFNPPPSPARASEEGPNWGVGMSRKGPKALLLVGPQKLPRCTGLILWLGWSQMAAILATKKASWGGDFTLLLKQL